MERKLQELIEELLDSVRTVTQLEIWRRALGRNRPSMADAVERCCAEGGGISCKTLGRYEHRITRACRLFEDALHKYFGVGSVALLGLGWEPEADRWWTWMTPKEVAEEMLHRRKMLRSMGLAGLAGTAGILLPVSDLVADAQELGGRGLDGRGKIHQGDAADAKKTATRLAIAYAENPGAEAVRAARAHAYTLLSLLKHNGASFDPPEVRHDLQAVASDAASLAGYAEMNAGRLDEADRWFRCALGLAREAGDRRLEALMLASRAWIPLYRHEPDRDAVIARLEDAAEFQSVLRPAGRAYVFGYLARERAALGDDLGSGRFLQEARRAAVLIPHDEPGWGWWSTRAELHIRLEMIGATRAMLLGRPAQALEVFDGALADTTKPVTLAYHHRRNAETCVALDDPERACASARAGLAIAKAHGLGLWPGEMRKARKAFPTKWHSHASVVELDELLRLPA